VPSSARSVDKRLLDAVGVRADFDQSGSDRFLRVEDRFGTEVAQSPDGSIVVHVSGEIDIETCERLRDVIEKFMGPRQTIVLDLSGVEFMDSSSLHVLLPARETLTADGGSLVLRNPSTAARRLLEAAQLQHLLDDDAADHLY
jgi:anti-sigma B factor antagonist